MIDVNGHHVRVPTPLFWAGAILVAINVAGMAGVSLWLSQPVCDPGEGENARRTDANGERCRQNLSCLIDEVAEQQGNPQAGADHADEAENGGSGPVNAIAENGPRIIMPVSEASHGQSNSTKHSANELPQLHRPVLPVTAWESIA